MSVVLLDKINFTNCARHSSDLQMAIFALDMVAFYWLEKFEALAAFFGRNGF